VVIKSFPAPEKLKSRSAMRNTTMRHIESRALVIKVFVSCSLLGSGRLFR
jgi:hypothetical protein